MSKAKNQGKRRKERNENHKKSIGMVLLARNNEELNNAYEYARLLDRTPGQHAEFNRVFKEKDKYINKNPSKREKFKKEFNRNFNKHSYVGEAVSNTRLFNSICDEVTKSTDYLKLQSLLKVALSSETMSTSQVSEVKKLILSRAKHLGIIKEVSKDKPVSISNGGETKKKPSSIGKKNKVVHDPLADRIKQREQQAIDKARAAGVIISTDKKPTTVTLADTKGVRTAEVTYRKSQGKFREIILEAYKGKCAVTGFSVSQVLEAAHYQPFNGNNDVIENGILLRSDIHKLLDAGLIHIDYRTNKLIVDKSIHDEYGLFHGNVINHTLSEFYLNKEVCK